MSLERKPDKSKYDAINAFNLSVASIGGQVGCLTLIIIFIALFVGLWLDKFFQTKPMFTILLTLGSIPVTIVMMLWVVRSTTKRMIPGAQSNSEKRNDDNQEEDVDSGKAP